MLGNNDGLNKLHVNIHILKYKPRPIFGISKPIYISYLGRYRQQM